MTRILLLCLAVTAACTGSPAMPPDPSALATALVRVAGNEQGGTVAMPLSVAPRVVVHDAAGQPVHGVPVQFSVTAGNGWVIDAQAVTDGAGAAETTWYLGPVVGTAQTLTVSAAGTLTAEFTATATALVSGTNYFGAESYIEFIAGDMPLIVSAGHGGSLRPASIPDRTGNVSTVQDLNTQELARTIRTEFQAEGVGAPHTIISRLHRIKLDPNREIVEAAQSNAEAERAWREYHGFIDAARAHVTAVHGSGFYIDVHGHGHDIQRLELGYLLSGSDLQLGDDWLDTPAIIAKSSIRGLVAGGRSHAELLRGPTSYGALFEARGYPAIPSPSQPHADGAPYFTGGYSTVRHGSRDGGPISGVQIEAHRNGVRDTHENRQLFAAALVEVHQAFWATDPENRLLQRRPLHNLNVYGRFVPAAARSGRYQQRSPRNPQGVGDFRQ